MTNFVRYAALVAGGLLISATAALAGPTYTFALNSSDVSQLNIDIGTITLTQNGDNAVNILVDLNPQGTGATYGFVNTGGSHTPFAFNLDSVSDLSISLFTQPTGGDFVNSGNFSFGLNTTGGSATPYGFFSVALDISPVQNGSNTGYFGDLAFTLTRAGDGATLSTSDFLRNGSAFFAADISDNENGGHTGTVAATTRTEVGLVETHADVPEPASFMMLGAGLLGLGAARRRTRG